MEILLQDEQWVVGTYFRDGAFGGEKLHHAPDERTRHRNQGWWAVMPKCIRHHSACLGSSTNQIPFSHPHPHPPSP